MLRRLDFLSLSLPFHLNASQSFFSTLSEEEVSKSSAACFLRKGLGGFLSFLFFSFSLLSLLDLESLGILSKLTSPLVCVTYVCPPEVT